MKIRYLVTSAAITVVAFSACKTPSKNAEVMIDTSRQKKETVVAPGAQPKSQAAELGDPTLSGRESEGQSDE